MLIKKEWNVPPFLPERAWGPQGGGADASVIGCLKAPVSSWRPGGMQFFSTLEAPIYFFFFWKDFIKQGSHWEGSDPGLCLFSIWNNQLSTSQVKFILDVIRILWIEISLIVYEYTLNIGKSKSGKAIVN